jgi:hypothetical protein
LSAIEHRRFGGRALDLGNECTMSTTLHTIRRSIWAISITAITVAGAWYGAGLKIEKEQRQVCSHTRYFRRRCPRTDVIIKAIEKRREASPAALIAQLEIQRGGLVAKRLGLEKKLNELEKRNQGATREESKEGMERKR